MEAVTVGARFVLLGLIAVAVAALFATLQIVEERRDHTAAREDVLRARVESVIATIARFEADADEERLTVAEAQDRALAFVRGLRYGDDEPVWIVDHEPRMILNPERPELEGRPVSGIRDLNGKAVFRDTVALAEAGGGFVSFLWPRSGTDQPVPKLSYVQRFDGWGWIVGTGVDVDDILAADRRNVARTVGIVAVVTLGAMVLGGLVMRSMTRPLGQLNTAMKALARGRPVDLPCLDREDEFGDLAKRVSAFCAAVIRELDQQIAARQEFEAKARADERVGALLEDFRRTSATLMDQMTDDLGRCTELADGVNRVVERTDLIVVDSADVVGHAAERVAVLAAATHRLNASIAGIAGEVEHSAAVIGAAAANTRETGDHIAGLARAAERIGEVVDLVQILSARTNVLALEATLKAAEAGESANGFAAMAEEVKTLAAQTARATQEIAAQASGIRGVAGSTLESVRAIADTIEDVGQRVSVIGAALDQQGIVTEVIDSTVEAAADSTDRTKRAVTDAADQVVAACQTVLDMRAAAVSVADRAERLNRGVAEFLVTVARP